MKLLLFFKKIFSRKKKEEVTARQTPYEYQKGWSNGAYENDCSEY